MEGDINVCKGPHKWCFKNNENTHLRKMTKAYVMLIERTNSYHFAIKHFCGPVNSAE